MRSHLWLDGLGGALLASSPWLFGFHEIVWAPHLIVGLLEIGVALMTQTVPALRARRISPAAVRGPSRTDPMR